MTTKILIGDALAQLAGLPDESVQCCVTSPPYYGLRCYDTEGQIGLEATPEAHIARLVEVFGEVKRVLRRDGVLWLNYGDAYAGSWGAQGRRETPAGISRNQINNHPKKASYTGTIRSDGIKPKDLLMLPARVALALQADGWWLRSMIPWLKRSAMPESASDRPATAVEYVFMLTKSGDTQYWQHRDGGATRTQPEPDYRWNDRRDGGETAQEPPNWRDEKFTNKQGKPEKRWQRFNLWRGWDYFYDAEAVRQDWADKRCGRDGSKQPSQRNRGGRTDGYTKPNGIDPSGNGGRNFRNSDLFFASLEPPHGLISDADGAPLALDVNPAGFAEAHFATFSPKLIEPLIKAATSEKGCCQECGAPWVREVEVGTEKQGIERGKHASAWRANVHGPQRSANGGLGTRDYKTLGWSPSCGCQITVCPSGCTVLDIPHGSKQVENQGTSEILLNMQGGIPGPTRDKQVVQPGLSSSVARQKSSHDKGLDDHEQGLQNAVATETPERDGLRLCDGASPSYGKNAGALADERRGGSSQERGQTGQPPRKPRIDDQAQTRQSSKADLSRDLPTLSEDISSQGQCPHCGSQLERTTPAPVPAVILDCFGGAGTTGLVADRLGRDAILIELNPNYAEMARKRISGDAPLFAEVQL